MDSDEEFLQFSDSEKQASPVPARKLKRLRKVTEKVSVDLHPSLPSDDAPSVHQVNLSVLETLGRGEKNVEDYEELSVGSGSQSEGSTEGIALDSESQLEGSEEGNELDSESQLEGLKEGIELDPDLDSFEVEKVGSGAKRALKFDSLGEEFDGKGVDQKGTEAEEESVDLRTEKRLEKKRRNLDGFEQKREKKKKRVKNADDGYDDNPYSVASTKRRAGKERNDRLKELRAESQRLLRETSDASFKPVPLVQKSVSSVLEKIRQRKQELSEKSVIAIRNSSTDGNHSISREVTLDFDIENFPIVDEVHNAGEAENEEISACPVGLEGRIDAQSAQGSKETANEGDENVTSQMGLDGDLKQTFRAPSDDTQDLIVDSQASDSKDEMHSNPLNEVLAPSLTTMNLRLDSAPDDISDEEDSNKENNDPLLRASVDLTSSPKGDPVKAFVDDEAEEEDDSDNDLARFQDNEEDEDNMDSEDLNDMIAIEYEEKPFDNEKRNELHQKWLEQQDAVGTENLLQRLKCSSKQREMAQIEESDNEESEEGEEEFLNDPAEFLVPRNAVRMNLKKAKEMIPQMFTDKDDVYVSSDDEETEKNLVKWRRFPDKADEQSTLLSPAKDEGSKEIFGLIKKLNCAPDARRKAKITSYFHLLSLGGSRTMSSKSSFLSRGRGARKSLPSFQNNCPSTVRSFVFERDDSNSRSVISTSEDTSDTVQKENRPKKTASAKFINSQVRSSSQCTQPMAEQKSGPSLHEILRCPSMQSNHFTRGSMAGQVEAIYAAFKLDQNLIKKEPAGVSIRTA